MEAKSMRGLLRSFRAGTTIIREGDSDRRVFVLRSGQCQVYKHDIRITSFNKEGTIFGEMSMILKRPRTATVMAETHVETYVMDVDVKTLITEYPHMIEIILQTLAERVAEDTKALYKHLKTAELNKLFLPESPSADSDTISAVPS